MNATRKQYKQAVKIYEEGGQSAVEEFASANGITSRAFCEGCMDETPNVDGWYCLVCGQFKLKFNLDD
jgi:hypothetical protein